MAAIMSYLYSILWWILVLGVIIYFVFVKKSRNRKAAETGEDKERVRQAAGQMLVGVNDYQMAYAHWEERESYGQAFARFITALAQQVAGENPGIDAVIAAEASESYGVIGAGLSIGGAIGAFVFPPFGAVLCLIGLILAIVGKSKGAKSKKGLIISIICILWAVFFNWLYFTIMW